MSAASLIPFVCSAIETAGLSIIDFRVLAHIYRRAGKDGFCYESYQNFAVCVGIHKETVSASIKRLKAAGFITGHKRLRPVDWKLMFVPAELDDADLTPREFRLLFHVIRKESRRESLESPCFSSFDTIAKSTRTARENVRSLVDATLAKGAIHKAIPRGLWSRYAKSRALSAPAIEPRYAEPKAVAPAIVSYGQTYDPTLDEMDEIEAQTGTTYSASARIAPPARDKLPPYRDTEREAARGLSTLLNRIADLPILPAFNVTDFKAIIKVEHTEFAGLPADDAASATALYGVRCLADSYPGYFSDAMNARDWQGAQAACFHRKALDVIALYAGLRLQSLTDTDKHSAKKEKINATFRFPGQALRQLDVSKNSLEACYRKAAEEAASILEEPLPVTVIGRYLLDTHATLGGHYKSLERPRSERTAVAA